MKFGVYTVYDCKTKEYSAPFIQREGAVERSLNEMLSKSPVPTVDLTLWQLGTWDSESGILVSFDALIFVELDFLGSNPFDDLEVVK